MVRQGVGDWEEVDSEGDGNLVRSRLRQLTGQSLSCLVLRLREMRVLLSGDIVSVGEHGRNVASKMELKTQ
jgi:hypothetical protein